MSRGLPCVCAAAAVAALVSCNDDNNAPTSPNPSPSPTATPSPTGCTQTTLASANPTLAWNVLSSTAFSSTQAGTVDITVDWQNANFNVGAWVVEAGTCSAERFNKGDCNFLAASGSDKPHKLSASLPAGSYELLLNNFGSGTRGGTTPETATVQIVLSTGCTPSPTPTP